MTAGNVIVRGFDFIFGVMLARKLGPEDFGTFTVLNTILLSSATIIRFGLNNSFLKIISDYKRKRLNDKEQILTNMYFWSRLIPAVPLVIIGIFLADFLGNVLSIPKTQVFLVRIAFAGVIGVCLFEYVETRYQANREFIQYTSLGLFLSGGRILSLILLFYFFNVVTLSVSVFVWLIFPMMAGIIGFASQPRDFITYRHGFKSELKTMLSFSKWIALSAYSMFLFRGMDVFFLSHYTSKYELGIYSAALNLGNIMFFLTNTLNVVLIPYACKLKDEQIWPVFKNSLLYGFPLFALCVGILLLSSESLLLIYGKEYSGGANVLRLLLIAFFCGAFLSPFAAIAYRTNIPKVIFYIDAIRGITGLAGFFIFIPRLGAMGAALSLLICYAVSMCLGLMFIYRKAILFAKT